jgi:pimeloyl-ACP methyl ester carboxylesterase
MSISISQYLTAQLPELGVRHMFGIPENFDDVNLRICIAKPRRIGELARFAIAAILCVAVVSSIPKSQAQESGVKNIVLVHGAWADGSGWRGVYDILVKDGFNVSVVQEPETSFQDDVAATRRILALQNGHCILVAHSYGGAVITEAGTDPSVAGLVYVAAHMPDAGENEADDGKRFPSDLSKSGAIKKTADGFTYLDPAQFHEYFAADLSAEQAAFMARSQVLNAADNFKAVITTPAWRSKPSWVLVAAKTGLSTLTLNDGTPSELIATWSKSQAPATQSTCRTPRKSRM